MHDKIAHTAEHAFIGSLQNTLGQTMRVRKVEHKENGNTAFIVTLHLDIEAVFKAELQVNSLIAEGRKVSSLSFPSLAEAKSQIPDLRANEERISGEVRVVKIEGHDVAACAMEHADNLSECDFFLVTRVSKSGSEYEVDFAVGRQAKKTAVEISAKLLNVCNELGANLNTVENTTRKIKSEGEGNLRKLNALTWEKLEGIQPAGNGKIVLLKGVFSNLAGEQLIEFAGKKIQQPNIIVLLANKNEESETASVVFARNENEQGDIDLNKLFKQIAGSEGRGGGKPHFVTGVIKKDTAEEIIEKISNAILH